MEIDAGVGVAAAGAPLVEGNAPSPVGSRRTLAPLRRLQRLLQGFLGQDAVPLGAQRRGVAGIQQVLQPEVGGVDAHLPGDLAHLRFHREDDLRASGGAGLGARNLVGVGADGLDADGRHPVVAGQPPGPQHRDLRVGLPRGVGAAGERDLAVDGGEGAVVRDANAETNHGGMAVRRGGDLLGVGEHHAHRPARLLGQEVAHRRVDHGSLAAEVSAHREDVDVDLLGFDAEVLGEPVLERERPLVGGPHLDVARIVHRHGAGVGLQVAVVRQLRGVGALEHPVGVLEAGVEVAVLPDAVGLDVGPVRIDALGQRRRVLVVARRVVERRGAGLDCLQRIVHTGQLFVVHLDEAQCLVGDLGRICGHRGHRVAHEPHLVPGQHRHVLHAQPHIDLRQVRARQHRVDPRQRPGLAGVDLAYARVRQRAAQHLGAEGIGYRQVRGVARGAGDFIRALDAGHGFSDGLIGQVAPPVGSVEDAGPSTSLGYASLRSGRRGLG